MFISKDHQDYTCTTQLQTTFQWLPPSKTKNKRMRDGAGNASNMEKTENLEKLQERMLANSEISGIREGL